MGRHLLTPEEARQRLRCSMPKIYALSSSGGLTKFKLGNRLFFDADDVEAYITANRIPAREELSV